MIPETTRVRWKISVLLLFLTVISYADRGVLGAVGAMLMKELHLSVELFGVVASGFGWGYMILVFLSGSIVNRLGPRRTYTWFVSLWSIVFIAIAAVGSFGSLLLLNIVFGGGEGTVFPCGSQLIGKWLPRTERGRAASLMAAGIPLGSLVVVPTSVRLSQAFGWRLPFVIFGGIGIVWLLVALPIITDTPCGNPRVSMAELKVIDAEFAEQSLTSSVPWGHILRSRTLWLAGLGFFSSAYTLYFMLTFFPTYLVTQRHIESAALALLGTIPWAAMTLAALLSGVVSDRIYRRHGDLRRARTYFAGTCLVVTGILIATTTSLTNTHAIVAVLSIASFVNFLANPIFFAIPIDVAPDFAGPASALTTGIGSAAGIAAPLLTGILVEKTGTYVSAFAIMAALPIIFGLLLIIACRPDRL